MGMGLLVVKESEKEKGASLEKGDTGTTVIYLICVGELVV